MSDPMEYEYNRGANFGCTLGLIVGAAVGITLGALIMWLRVMS